MSEDENSSGVNPDVPAVQKSSNPAGTGQEERAAIRRVQALKYRTAGMTYREIAEQLGCVKSAAWKYVQDALAELKEERMDLAENLRDLELARLEDFHRRLYRQLADKDLDAEELRRAIDRLLKVSERRSKMLGLDAPERFKIDFSVVDEVAVQIARVAVRYIPEEMRDSFRADLAELMEHHIGEDQS